MNKKNDPHLQAKLFKKLSIYCENKREGKSIMLTGRIQLCSRFSSKFYSHLIAKHHHFSIDVKYLMMVKFTKLFHRTHYTQKEAYEQYLKTPQTLWISCIRNRGPPSIIFLAFANSDLIACVLNAKAYRTRCETYWAIRQQCISGVPKKAEWQIFSTLRSKSVIVFLHHLIKHIPQKRMIPRTLNLVE